ncbi:MULTISPECIES: hypothetical protein [unclassified Mameliella]|uniref:hypothetical protein n=2 Tax=Mameliella TaxID=1434019 RepID=UPI00273F45F8|nr:MULTISPECIES: hypothetical protein [unclassified Mameliella]
MTRKKITKKRAALLADLEQIVGSSCYNGNIQNWGPNGVQYRDGRSFRYPLAMLNEDGEQIKLRSTATNVTPEVLWSGHYKFGANRLHIIQALDEVLAHLEEAYGLKI